jgi:hypothetical protein
MAGIFAELAVELGGAVCAHAKVAIAIQAMAVSSFPGSALVVCMDRALGRARGTFSLDIRLTSSTPFGASAYSPTLKRFLSAACQATTAAICQKGLQIVLAVVIRNFLLWLDLMQRHDHNPALATHRLCIRPTGMVDVACHIPSRRSVDYPSLVEREHVSCAQSLTPVRFLCGNAAAAIGRDAGSSLYSLCRKQAKPGH